MSTDQSASSVPTPARLWPPTRGQRVQVTIEATVAAAGLGSDFAWVEYETDSTEGTLCLELDSSARVELVADVDAVRDRVRRLVVLGAAARGLGSIDARVAELVAAHCGDGDVRLATVARAALAAAGEVRGLVEAGGGWDALRTLALQLSPGAAPQGGASS